MAALASLALAPGTGTVADASPSACSGGAWSPNVVNPWVRPISRATIIQRGRSWIGTPGTEYCTAENFSNPYGTYRKDCSGFVSMAWGMNGSYSTQSLPQHSTRLTSFSSMQPGDAVIRQRTSSKSGHVMLFVGWANGQGVFWNEASAGRRALEVVVSTSSLASGGYVPYRYNQVINSAGGIPDAQNPIGVFDSLDARGAGTIGMWGWTFDPDTPRTSIPVHVYLTGSDGVRRRHVLTANYSRPGVAAAHPAAGDRHGFEAVLSGLPRGSMKVEVYGIDSSNQPNDYANIGTRWVTVP